MTTFWLIAGGLTLLAMLFLLPTFLRKDLEEVEASSDDLNIQLYKEQTADLKKDLERGDLTAEEHESAQQDLEKELIYDLSGKKSLKQTQGGSWMMFVLVFFVPLVSVVMYLQIGASKLVPVLENPVLAQAPARQAQSLHAAQPGQEGAEQLSIQELIQRLIARLQENPEDPRGWSMLARTMMGMNRFEDAARAYVRWSELQPNNADVYTGHAEAMAMLQERSLAGEPTRLLDKALEVDPQDVKARWLRGIAYYQEDAHAQAIELWEGLLAVIPPDSPDYQEIIGSIEDARALMNGEQPASVAQAPVEAAPAPAQPASGGAKLTVSVTLDAALQSQVQSGDTVFVFARAANGPRMPLAIVRKTVADLPMTVSLDDSMAMTPAMTLSTFPKVVVGARVSKSGNAMPQPGDLNGFSAEVTPTHADVINIVIDSKS